MNRSCCSCGNASYRSERFTRPSSIYKSSDCWDCNYGLHLGAWCCSKKTRLTIAGKMFTKLKSDGGCVRSATSALYFLAVLDRLLHLRLLKVTDISTFDKYSNAPNRTQTLDRFCMTKRSAVFNVQALQVRSTQKLRANRDFHVHSKELFSATFSSISYPIHS